MRISPTTARTFAYALALVGVNVYICREMFFYYTAHTNSMQGFWIAMAKLGGTGWFHPVWWPYWDCGIPFEFAYAPLVPGLTALVAVIRGIGHDTAFQFVSGVFYCLVPVTLFAMATMLTRAPGYSFVAALLYSLTSPAQLLVPDEPFAFGKFWNAQRIYLAAVWDETPHLAALSICPVAIVCLWLAIANRRWSYYLAAVLSIALSALASDFGPIMIALSALCLVLTLSRGRYLQDFALISAIGLCAYAICLPFLSPSHLEAIRAAAPNAEHVWTLGSFTALGLAAAGCIILVHYLPRLTPDWTLQFFALLTFLVAVIPFSANYLHREFLPQPNRYKVELDFCLALLFVFAAKPIVERMPRGVRASLLLFLIPLCVDQIVSYRKFAKAVLWPIDVTKTIEYRVSRWAGEHLHGTRIMLPGSIGKWANAFTDLQQFGAGSWSIAYSQIQQSALAAMYNGGSTPEQDARVSIAWLKAFGVDAVAVSGPRSEEKWKGFVHPAKYEGVLPVLWSEDDVTIYRVLRRSASLAHIVPQTALVRHAPTNAADIVEVERYVAALEDTSLPITAFEWRDRNRVHLHTTASPGQAISVQVSYHPGWHATANSRPAKIQNDGLGLMWLDPGCNGPCDVELHYNGGVALLSYWLVSYTVLAALLLSFVFFAWRRRSRP